PGDPLFGATLNKSGSLVMEARKVGADTVLARIVEMVAEAQRSRAPIQRLADLVASYFVPAVVAVALLAFLGWSLFGPAPAMAYGLVAAVSVLIIACPCALGLATPMSIMVATGKGARAGVLFRDAEAIERLREVDTLVVDKTGTLTSGRPELVAVEVSEDLAEDADSEKEMLRLVASLERASEHPLSEAIVRGALARGLALAEPSGFESITGKGIHGEVEDRRLAVGNPALLRELEIESAGWVERAEVAAAGGRTVVIVAIDGKAIGLLAVEDPVKATTPEALEALRRQGLEVVMLTGDSRVTAETVARRLDIDRVVAGVLPDGKAEEVARLQHEGRVVAMAGDGINDAPALALADVGIAMGTGTDVAMESSAVTLLEGDLRALVRARRLSRHTMTNIRQNLFFAFAYNTLGVPIAAGVLYPVFGLLLSPMIAAAAMSLSSVSVITNALRLHRLEL
ncbi:MAG: heavy metal translocating P-type ATPase, partial [Holophagales bacterium]|nr:heavy metal translocating P-type ATPase [Holophagales bacterium]